MVLGAWRPLVDLFRDLEGVDEIVPLDWDRFPAVEADLVTSLLDLPARLLLTPEELGMPAPYLHADPDRVQAWAQRLQAPGRRIGLVWAGSPRHVNDRHRSCRLETFRPLLEVPGVTWFSLQKDLPDPADRDRLAAWGVRDLGPDLGDLADTAAVMAHLDRVVTVDTAALHLAGALGRPVWGLIPHNPDWRWMRDRSDSPWYPTCRLFRQETPGDWDTVVARVAEALRDG